MPPKTITKEGYEEALDELISMGSSEAEAIEYLTIYTIVKEN